MSGIFGPLPTPLNSPYRVGSQTIVLERALCINRRELHESVWMVIGRVARGTPFLLIQSGGSASWECARRLDAPIRRDILALFSKSCRVVPRQITWVEFHDLADLERVDAAQARAEARARVSDFHRKIWRGQFLHDFDEDYLILKVPFAEKDQAKAAGARWEPFQRVWRVKRTENLEALVRWC